MKLDPDVNYIVSGLERSGTSMMMQILHAGGLPIGFDESRKSDESNPRGYYELEGGKIINKLKDGLFPLHNYRGMIIKITAYGLQYLPHGQYMIMYMERDLDEIMDSMEKMTGKKDPDRNLMKMSFRKLNEKVKQDIQKRPDVSVLFINYNEMVLDSEKYIQEIVNFLGLSQINELAMKDAIDGRLYRQRRQS